MENNRTDLQDLSQKSQHGSADAPKKLQLLFWLCGFLAVWDWGDGGAGGVRGGWRPICSPSRLAAFPSNPRPLARRRSAAKSAVLWLFHRGILGALERNQDFPPGKIWPPSARIGSLTTSWTVCRSLPHPPTLSALSTDRSNPNLGNI